MMRNKHLIEKLNKLREMLNLAEIQKDQENIDHT
jgi:hypothetical protein